MLKGYYNARLRAGFPDSSSPWSVGYSVYKRHLLAQTLTDQYLLDRFFAGAPLPAGYGTGIDERCVEYPWVLAQLRGSGCLLLDAGSAMNHDILIGHPIVQQKTMHILTLAPEKECFWHKGISYLFADLRDIPIRNEYYETIVSISTLEHIGFDNTLYSKQLSYCEHCPEDVTKAMHQLSRVLKPGGLLLFTVPFGASQDCGSFRQFDRKSLSKAIGEFDGCSRVTETFYLYRKEGWNVASSEDCAQCRYVDWVMKPSQERPAQFIRQPDGAVAARAVACVRLEKKRGE
jgi:SAM-dependent methyltransferase